MPRSINEVHVAGHAGKDAELKYIPNGTALANFSIATGGGKKKDGSGDWPTEWHGVVAWAGMAEKASEIRKGVFVDVRGRIQTRSWDDRKSGEKRYKTEIVATSITIGESGGGSSFEREIESAPVPQSTRIASPSHASGEITDEDIPF